jgi:NAD(P)-dependent dehydrogenase (short-subunit alcohol dehydrogenase family)
MGTLDGRVAIVTGAGAGIGRGVALALGSAGAGVVLMGRRPEPLDAVVAELEARGARALAVPGDVGKPADVERCVARTLEKFGRLDILVNNAQGYRHAALADVTEEDMDLVWRTGPLASFRFMRHAYPHLRKTQGVIVNFGSGTQFDPSESFHASYNLAKMAIQGLTRSAAVEWGREGIRTFLVVPAAESPQLQAFKARDPVADGTSLDSTSG